MRFGAILLLILTLLVGAAPSDASAHEGGTGEITAIEDVAAAPGTLASAAEFTGIDGQEHVGAGVPSGHHGTLPGSPDCLTVSSCGGASGVLGDALGIPVPQVLAPATLAVAGYPPQGIDLPIEDRPPRAC